MDFSFLISHLKSSPLYRQQITHIEHIPERKARYGELEIPLNPYLQRHLENIGLFPLYTHQAEAINSIRKGKNIVISTPAASGKSLCYNLPVLEALIKDKQACFLYIFPTKALSQDQWRAFKEFSSPFFSPNEGGTFDGDTPPDERRRLKKKGRLILTNPDMLHLGILPNHNTWARFFRNLRFVIIDEAHAYRGVFGSHVAQVLRRLRRICSLYGSKPQFILSSATLANPKEHAQNLVGLPFEEIKEDGSPYGGKEFVFWNPPFIDSAQTIRRSANSEASFLLSELVSHHIRSLVFAPTRKLTELIYIYSLDRLSELNPSLCPRVKPYRAGYLPEVRREIERELFTGELLGVVATTALEMGIDIGNLDATILTGYPGSIASTWQQAGRSGRRGEVSISFFIASNNPLDQYFIRHPEALLGREVENALINTQNPHILKPHLLCAAWEFPLREEDEEIFGPAFSSLKEELASAGIIRERGGRYYLSPSISYPAQDINLRATSEKAFSIIDLSTNCLLETVEASVAFLQIHPGAIYLHQGESYLIKELDLFSRTAYALPVDADYYTQALEINSLRILKVIKEREINGRKVFLGEVEVSQQVIGYKKKRQFTEEVIGVETLDLPPYIYETIALWFDLPEVEGIDMAGGLHALEHSSIALLPLFALCDRNDIGGLSTPFHPDTGKPQVFIYDAYPGGIGIAEKGFEIIERLWQTALRAIEECPCKEGCPSCIQSPKCGNNNQPLDKKSAITLLQKLVLVANPNFAI